MKRFLLGACAALALAPACPVGAQVANPVYLGSNDTGSTSTGNGSAKPITITHDSPPGDARIAVGNWHSTALTGSVVDSSGCNYTPLTLYTYSLERMQGFICPNAAVGMTGGVGTITLTLSGNQKMVLEAATIGGASAAPIDGQSATAANGTGATATASALTAVASNVIMVGFAAFAGASNDTPWTPASGWTCLASHTGSGGNTTLSLCYQAVASGAGTFAMTDGGASGSIRGWGAAAIAIKPPSASTATGNGLSMMVGGQ